jgi:hypothetical protein
MSEQLLLLLLLLLLLYCCYCCGFLKFNTWVHVQPVRMKPMMKLIEQILFFVTYVTTLFQ